jgi:hypothetical protein
MAQVHSIFALFTKRIVLGIFLSELLSTQGYLSAGDAEFFSKDQQKLV